jgi:hypothetical protein
VRNLRRRKVKGASERLCADQRLHADKVTNSFHYCHLGLKRGRLLRCCTSFKWPRLFEAEAEAKVRVGKGDGRGIDIVFFAVASCCCAVITFRTKSRS